MNHFEKLSSKILEQLMTFCDGKSIVSLSATCKQFYELIKDSNKLMGKVRLIEHFGQKLNDGLIARSRRFQNLKIIFVKQFPEVKYLDEEEANLLKFLSNSIVNLTIEQQVSEIDSDAFELFLQRFLSKIQVCCLDALRINYGGSSGDEGYNNYRNQLTSLDPNRDTSDDYPLKVLKIRETCCESFKFFSACRQLETFEFKAGYLKVDQRFICSFLLHHSNLKNLRLEYSIEEDWNETYPNVVFTRWAEAEFQLETFEIFGAQLKNPTATAQFFAKQTKIKKLRVLFNFHDPLQIAGLRGILKSICELPELKELHVSYKACFKYILEKSVLEGLENGTVERLDIIAPHCPRNDSEICKTADTFQVELIRIFNNAKHINLLPRDELKDFIHFSLDDVPVERLQRINIQRLCCFRFQSPTVPEKWDEFESAVVEFIAKYKSQLKSLTIGHEDWFKNDFRMPLSFREALAENLSSLQGRRTPLESDQTVQIFRAGMFYSRYNIQPFYP